MYKHRTVNKMSKQDCPHEHYMIILNFLRLHILQYFIFENQRIEVLLFSNQIFLDIGMMVGCKHSSEGKYPNKVIFFKCLCFQVKQSINPIWIPVLKTNSALQVYEDLPLVQKSLIQSEIPNVPLSYQVLFQGIL